jgi:hypothetical protein
VTTTWVSQCNQSGARLVGEYRSEFFERGWMEVHKGEDEYEALEFCDQDCLVNYFRGEGA